jgi:RNA polymerase sigma-70 factor (ECF subfamily)
VEFNDEGFADLLKQGNQQAFEKVFLTFYKGLHAYAFTILGDPGMAEELVQDLFYKLWKKKDTLTVTGSLKAYLYKAIYHECLDHFKHAKTKTIYRSHVLYHHQNSVAPEDATLKMRMDELEKKIRQALNDLPDECRTIFQLSRFEGLKYQQIAAQLGLSLKTVETQISIALKRLRKDLAEFLSY